MKQSIAQMKVLVTGGAGYIGSHMAKYLIEKNCIVTVLDNLSTGHLHAVKKCNFVEGDLADQKLMGKVFSETQFDAVFHFAAFSQVGESVEYPLEYFRNNVSNTASLLHVMKQAEVNYLVYSSSAAVYGIPASNYVSETDPTNPINPYGRSKLVVEKLIEDCSAAGDLKAVCLRYFNAAGADPQAGLGECHEPETHLIPLVLQVASGKKKKITVYGDDYETPDGTCIRDFIHVRDLCEAHWLGLRQLMQKNTKYSIYNLGNGEGFSVLKVISCSREVTGKEIKCVLAKRRPGDPARLVANTSLARKELGWCPKYSDIKKIIEDAWIWERTMASTMSKR